MLNAVTCSFNCPARRSLSSFNWSVAHIKPALRVLTLINCELGDDTKRDHAEKTFHADKQSVDQFQWIAHQMALCSVLKVMRQKFAEKRRKDALAGLPGVITALIQLKKRYDVTVCAY